MQLDIYDILIYSNTIEYKYMYICIYTHTHIQHFFRLQPVCSNFCFRAQTSVIAGGSDYFLGARRVRKDFR